MEISILEIFNKFVDVQLTGLRSIDVPEQERADGVAFEKAVEQANYLLGRPDVGPLNSGEVVITIQVSNDLRYRA